MDAPLPQLGGAGVLVTRPAHQAEGLCRLIEAAGGQALRYPVIAIEPLPDDGLLAERLRGADLAVFVSANAVREARARLGAGFRRPPGLRVAAVGEATARALAEAGLAADVVPAQGADSEALLAEPALQDVAGRRVLVVRGEGGRELLAETLRRRGAEVAHVALYRRVRPPLGPEPLLRWRRAGLLDVALATSVEALENLAAMAGEVLPHLQQRPLVAVSGRVVQRARALGFARPWCAGGAGDRTLLEAVAAALAADGEQP
ncbi:uroporphyrinogen-III synthase [Inmirania thermothiophila]|uniref:Uroporphyrinogen-III synthase n=1 Tax=Inmirania thermothiophila TaxID=1750597 RepID=A0A3N1Y6J1_9GAMM|nr:uroporphyrinogen-III synthase [Inmirania thermothiophila]ROR34395.1 uroporphyrinogen-III synthase [Inmirania thermothiophila]